MATSYTTGLVGAVLMIGLIMGFLVGIVVGESAGKRSVKREAVTAGAAHWGDLNGAPLLEWHNGQ